MQVCVPTTPAQIFHLLRRQAIRPLRKPLVIMSPKSLLRHKRATSTLDELANGQFQTVLPEIHDVDPLAVKRVIMCSGKVYYDLLEYREENNITDTAIIRIEQLYPFPGKKLDEALAPFKNTETLVWCQEEPMNQGTWYCSQHHMRNAAQRFNPSLNLRYAGRRSAAAPATGLMSQHLKEQQELVEAAFAVV